MREKILKIYVLCIALMTACIWVSAADIENLQLENTKVHIENTLKIDVSPRINDYEETLWVVGLSFEWDIPGASTIDGPVLERNFQSTGIKEVTLRVFSEIDGERTLLLNSGFQIFVYDQSIPFIFSDSVTQSEKKDFKDIAAAAHLYVHEVVQSSETDLYWKNIINSLESYYAKEKWKSDYIGVWGEKDFLFSVISKINKEQEDIEEKRTLNFLLLSGFNENILKGYLGNLLTNKDYIGTSLIMSDTLIFQVTKSPTSIQELEKKLQENSYDYINIDTKTGISKYFFISRFINTLSNSWVNTSDIFILIMIPVILTLISFMKHFIGISPIGISIPLFLSILFFKMWVSFTLVVLAILFLINMFITKGINRYNLLYTPKIGFLVTINIVLFFLALEYLLRYDIISLWITDIVYIILFIVVSEKMITVLISKEFREYKRNLWGTLLVGFIGFLVLQISALEIFMLAYPEVIIALAPINFLMWRFTGLRVTEYLRFKEIIKNIEE